jgi:hypothetical protein
MADVYFAHYWDVKHLFSLAMSGKALLPQATYLFD